MYKIISLNFLKKGVIFALFLKAYSILYLAFLKLNFFYLPAYENHFNIFKNFLQNVSAGKGEGYKEKKKKGILSS